MKAVGTGVGKGNSFSIVAILFVVCIFLNSSTSFAFSGATPIRPQESTQQSKNSSDAVSLARVDDKYEKQITKLQSDNALLADKLTKMQASFTMLNERKSKPTESLSFAEWSGILLACVAIIVTVLGVVVAIFSFVGYRKVLDSAKESAGEVADRHVAEKIHDCTRKELQALFSNKALFDKNSAEYKNLAPVRQFLLEAVSKVIYREIQFDISENESDTENDE